jgi:L-serine dehydratase
MARTILGEKPEVAMIELHGSFAQTYKGHGTDKALAAGLLGFSTDDVRIRDALTLAPINGLQISFQTVDLGEKQHPNTAVLHLTGVSGRKTTIVGSSLGGGSILITEIDGYAVELSGDYYTLISIHQDKPGIIALVTHLLSQENVNIAFMRVSRQQRGSQALMILETDQPIPEHALTSIRSIPAVQLAMLVPPL